MGFRINCDINYTDDDGKPVKCRREMEPVIDKNTGEVFCECGKKLTKQDTLTGFAKRQMVALGQVRKEETQKKAFSVTCESCKKNGAPILDSKGAKLLCASCKQELKNLNAPFAQMLRQNLRAQKRAG